MADNIAELMSDYLDWDLILIQELAIPHDDGDITQNSEQLEEGGHIMITNAIKKWVTAIIIHRRWADRDWQIRETGTVVIITSKDSTTKRITVCSAHLPEAWHHSDEEYQTAVDEIHATLEEVGAYDGDIIMGVDANGGRSEADIDGEQFNEQGALELSTTRSEIWASFVRNSGMIVHNTWQSERNTRGSSTLRAGDRRRHVDWILTTAESAEGWVPDEARCRSDHRPVSVAWPAEQGELLEFKNKNNSAPRKWSPTATNAARIQRYWAESINGGENIEQIQTKLEELAKQETRFAEEELARCRVDRDDAAPLTAKEKSWANSRRASRTRTSARRSA